MTTGCNSGCKYKQGDTKWTLVVSPLRIKRDQWRRRMPRNSVII
nr:MAG TPA_asm: Radical SAM superfamily [Caudoviricetes sp.]